MGDTCYPWEYEGEVPTGIFTPHCHPWSHEESLLCFFRLSYCLWYDSLEQLGHWHWDAIMSGFCACGVVVMVLWFLEFAGAMHHSLPEVPGLTAASVDEDRPELPSVEGELPAAEGELPAAEGELPAVEGELPAAAVETPEPPAAAVETPEPPAAAVDEDRPAAALDEEMPELVEERPVPPESAAAAPSSSSESTEAERRRRRRRRRAADRREEAMLRILVELQAQTRTMHDNHRELMDRVLSLASQTAQTATAERSTARRAPRARCNTCVACTVAPPPGTGTV